MWRVRRPSLDRQEPALLMSYLMERRGALLRVDHKHADAASTNIIAALAHAYGDVLKPWLTFALRHWL